MKMDTSGGRAVGILCKWCLVFRERHLTVRPADAVILPQIVRKGRGVVRTQTGCFSCHGSEETTVY